MTTLADLFGAMRDRGRSKAHECTPMPIAARTGVPHEDWPDGKVLGTLVLYRCQCGLMQGQLLPGVWTARELGVPCGDAEAVDALVGGQ